ncbi:MAG: hypothetical protein AMJ90_07780 [candidate division Zixibacteria bacterium SM23_73_2]|nr:MAG: hypothetical protein AMJ90_07780 [candidate division Zixibacteria bacterium SM23_73_2]
MKSIGIVANPKKPKAKKSIQKIILWAKRNKIDCFFSDELKNLISKKEKLLPLSTLSNESEIMMSLGGDGTMLKTARAVGRGGNPILGINLGSLGFITETTSKNLDNALRKLLKKEYQIEKRMVLKAKIDKKNQPSMFALNDVVIDKGGVARLIQMHLYDGEDFVCSYSADGLIISTPTGSTAYSLATGGPIINPKTNAIIVAPICPHTLASRPIIFSENHHLKIVVECDKRDALFTVDGQIDKKLISGDSVLVSKARHTVNLIKFPGSSFYSVLRKKLHWGARPSIEE